MLSSAIPGVHFFRFFSRFLRVIDGMVFFLDSQFFVLRTEFFSRFLIVVEF